MDKYLFKLDLEDRSGQQPNDKNRRRQNTDQGTEGETGMTDDQSGM